MPIVYGHDEQGFFVAHEEPQCKEFAAKLLALNPDEVERVLIDVDGGRVYPIGTQGKPS